MRERAVARSPRATVLPHGCWYPDLSILDDVRVSSSEMTWPRHLRRRRVLLEGPIAVGDLLEIIAAAGGHPTRIEAQIEKVYEWRHARGLTVLQLALAPAAVAALAVVAKGDTPAVVLVAVGIVLLSVAAVGWRLYYINRLHTEYALALRLGQALGAFGDELACCIAGQASRSGHQADDLWEARSRVGAELYVRLGGITMAEYLSRDGRRDEVRRVLDEQLDTRPVT